MVTTQRATVHERQGLRGLRRRLLAWYDANARDLPWRGEGCTPYRVLVSEFMLQQTQVATVVPYFQRFVSALPTLRDLAAADGQAVLRLWQGLGYYARARNLQDAARVIVDRHAGEVPRRVEQLLELPGVGRYTAGAVASLAWGARAPVLDGNVARVLCRLDLIRVDTRLPAVKRRLWKRAMGVLPSTRCGDFNSALMELGATVCTPRKPACPSCPLRRDCRARAMGLQERIPRAGARKRTPLLLRDVFVIRSPADTYLIEQRPPRGRWASMWQFITRPHASLPPLRTSPHTLVGTIRHALTHRRYQFRVFACSSGARAPAGTRWAGGPELNDLPMPRPHLRVLAMNGMENRTGA